MNQLSEGLHVFLENGVGYVWFIILAVWGGTASYFSRLKKSGFSFSMVELVGEWTISGFSGIVTAFVCKSMQIDFYMTAALVGMSGHMGGRGIYMFEVFIKNRWTKVFGEVEREENEKS